MEGHADRKGICFRFARWTVIAAGALIAVFWALCSLSGRAGHDVIQQEKGMPLPGGARVVEVMLERGSGGMLAGALDRLLMNERPRGVVHVPASSICRMGQVEMVQVVENGCVFSRLVKTGPADRGSVKVLSGLREGERVLLRPVACDQYPPRKQGLP